ACFAPCVGCIAWLMRAHSSRTLFSLRWQHAVITLTARICPCSRPAYLRCSIGVSCKAVAAVVNSGALNRALLARLLSDDALGIAVVDEHGVASDVEAFRGNLQAHEPICPFTPAHARSRTHSTVRMQDNYKKVLGVSCNRCPDVWNAGLHERCRGLVYQEQHSGGLTPALVFIRHTFPPLREAGGDGWPSVIGPAGTINPSSCGRVVQQLRHAKHEYAPSRPPPAF
ncbi:unnamed protein product, partial [Ectocarpus sp. 12 AP-2014]